MKTLAKVIMLLVVLGFCLPSHAEILVYKGTQNGTSYDLQQEEWTVDKESGPMYIVMDVDYVGGTITQSTVVGYGKDADGKWFSQDPLNLELVRVDDGARVRWVVMEKDVQVDGEQISGGFHFHMLAGLAGNKNVGTGEKQEVASKLTGYGLEDRTEEGQRSVRMSTISFTFYPAWTYWANGEEEDEGNQDFDTTVQMIVDYLTNKGYEEQEP
jgi:hypothetical protein